MLGGEAILAMGDETAERVHRHVECVDAWLGRVGAAPTPQLLEAFQAAFNALWVRSLRPLGKVTLSAIVDRVLCTVSEAFPALGTLQVESRAVLFRDFRARARRLSNDEVAAAIRLILVEFLRVLGTLTAEILTPALHAELSNLSLPKTNDAHPGRRAPSKARRRPKRTKKT
jgi:hypothetical protein